MGACITRSDDHLFTGDPDLLVGSVLYELSKRFTCAGIATRINMSRGEPAITKHVIAARLATAMKDIARRSHKALSSIARELCDARRENGISIGARLAAASSIADLLVDEEDEAVQTTSTLLTQQSAGVAASVITPKKAVSTKKSVDDAIDACDDEIFRGNPGQIRGDTLIQLAGKYQLVQIAARINSYHGERSASRQSLTQQLHDDIDEKAVREGRTKIQIADDINQSRIAHGVKGPPIHLKAWRQYRESLAAGDAPTQTAVDEEVVVLASLMSAIGYKRSMEADGQENRTPKRRVSAVQVIDLSATP